MVHLTETLRVEMKYLICRNNIIMGLVGGYALVNFAGRMLIGLVGVYTEEPFY